jgi:hypothetical protein
LWKPTQTQHCAHPPDTCLFTPRKFSVLFHYSGTPTNLVGIPFMETSPSATESFCLASPRVISNVFFHMCVSWHPSYLIKALGKCWERALLRKSISMAIPGFF